MGAVGYEPQATLREARQQHFKRSALGDGGYERRWFKLHFGPVWIPLPNWPARIRAVKLHDLHHVLTGYTTRWSGEIAIAAWEIASGCGRYSAAWLLNLGGFAVGLVLGPGIVYRAFVRGRHSRNLYATVFDDALLARRVGEVRRELGLDTPPVAPSSSDKLAFVFWAAIAVVVTVLPYAIGATLLLLLLR